MTKTRRENPSLSEYMILNASASYSIDEEELVAPIELVDSYKAFYTVKIQV